MSAMEEQTTTLPSSTTASSSSTSASSTTSANDSDATGTSFFTPGGSPPLILAFLAIGLFTAAMIAVFGYRRIHWGRPWTSEIQVEVDRSARRRHDFGEKPKLWDVWATRGITEVERGWTNILPFSASTITHEGPSQNRSTHRMSGTTNNPIDARLHKFPILISRFLPTSDTNDTTNTPETRLRVALPIAMPSQRCESTVGSDNGTSSKEQRLEYSIGLLEVPWEKAEEG